MIARAPASPPLPPLQTLPPPLLFLLLHLLSPCLSAPVFYSLFQRDKERKKEKPTAAKQQLHLQTRRHYNGAAAALPRQHTGRWGGGIWRHRGRDGRKEEVE